MTLLGENSRTPLFFAKQFNIRVLRDIIMFRRVLLETLYRVNIVRYLTIFLFRSIDCQISCAELG